jgi:ribosomal-protein-alanine N-acetyltransferase
MDPLSPDTLQIEQMKSYDLPAIASLHAICFEDSWHAELLGRILSAPGAFGLFGRARGAILSLAVAPGARRIGLASALLDAAKAYAVKHDIEALFLEVAEDNVAARQLYEKYGFATVGRRAHYYRRRYGPSVDAMTLRCELTSISSCDI